MSKAASLMFHVWKGLSNHGVGVARGAVFQEIRPGAAGFKSGDFLKKTLGEATVERLAVSLPSMFLIVRYIYVDHGTVHPLASFFFS